MVINLFYKADMVIEQYREKLELTISEAFILCAAEKLSIDFERKTGIKPSNPKLISFVPEQKDEFKYVKGEVSTIKQRLYVNHNWNDVSWSWYSKSGRIVDMADTDIDCDDLVFSFNDLDPLLIQKQMYPKEKLPFKLKDLTYELTVERLNMEMTIEANFKPGSAIDAGKISDEAIAFVGKFNEKLLKKNYSGVHKFKPEIQEDKICFDIDTGYTGPVFLKQFLRFLSDKNVFVSVAVL